MAFTETIQLKGIWMQPMIIDNQLFFISSDYNLEVIDLDNMKSRKTIAADVYAYKVMWNQLLVSSKDSFDLSIYNTAGQKQGDEYPGLNILSAAAMDDHVLIYQKPGESALYRRDLRNKTDDFVMAGTIDYFSEVVGNILVSSTSAPFRSNILGYDIKNRELAWEYSVKEIGKHYDVVAQGMQDGHASQVKFFGGSVYVLTDPKLIAIDANTGSELWTKDVNPKLGKIMTSAPDTGDLLLYNAEFQLIDSKTGSTIRQSRAFRESFRSRGMRLTPSTYPVVAGNFIYITFVLEGKLVIMERETFEIAEVIDLANYRDTIPESDSPLVFNNKILQRSGDKIMHVYEST